jgi:hypothetical protein
MGTGQIGFARTSQNQVMPSLSTGLDLRESRAYSLVGYAPGHSGGSAVAGFLARATPAGRCAAIDSAVHRGPAWWGCS